jgi:hypothetical protein
MTAAVDKGVAADLLYASWCSARDVCVMHPFCSPNILSMSSGLKASNLNKNITVSLILLKMTTGRAPYHTPAEVRSVLIHDPEAALHKLELELGVSPIAQLWVHGVAAASWVIRKDIHWKNDGGRRGKENGGWASCGNVTYGANCTNNCATCLPAARHL